MAGKPGMKGGGGARPGAGRKPKQKVVLPDSKVAGGEPGNVLPAETDMLAFLQKVALGQTVATTIQVRAAIAAVQYTHTKRGDGGKKDEQADKAKKAGGGKFGAAQPPRLVHSR